MAHFLDVLNDRVLLCDGGMGTSVHDLNLDLEKDFWGYENCTDILTRSRPDAILGIHMAYLEAGADIVCTDTFGASPVTLGEFDLADEAYALNKGAVELARQAVEAFAGDGRTRFVVGDVGPGTKLPSLGHIDYDTLENSYTVQCAGLIAGGADAILIFTCQDPLQIKAAVNGARRARCDAAAETPILVQVTMETTGTLLVGSEIAAAATVVQSLEGLFMGLNCATGPQEMAPHVKWLRENWPGLLGVQPNAGLPELVEGQPSYPLTPAELAMWMERFLVEDGLNLIGGCCGTNETHTKALDAMLRRHATKGSRRPVPVRRDVHWLPAVASLYAQVPVRRDHAFLLIGERCNAIRSSTFRALEEAGDWDGCVALGRDQEKAGAGALDVRVSGGDEVAEMTEFVSRLRGAVSAALVIDTDDCAALEAALKLYGGKAVVNAIDFAHGEAPAAERLALARRFGAAVIARTADETGPAGDAAAALRVARRLHDFACGRHGLSPGDLWIDPLCLPMCTDEAADRGRAVRTLAAVESIAQALPACQIVLGLSNLSAGLPAAARQVLERVFLDHARRRGLSGAIADASRIASADDIRPDERRAAEDVIFDRRSAGGDPLPAFLDLTAARRGPAAEEAEGPLPVDERLKRRIIDGERKGLEGDLDEALETLSPLDIVNQPLLDGMKVVGDLFGEGKMPLPFVLESAQTMKAAVAYLEPHMDRVEGEFQGTIVLATVKGDIHDIGKNLVDIILTNNGYRVINLGAKQPIEAIIEAVREHRPDVVGMSGLLIRSAVIMRENLAEMTRQGLNLPVFLGGAALKRKYVEEDCAPAYGGGRVAYGGDAFDGLRLMEIVMSGDFDGHVAAARQRRDAPRRNAGPDAGQMADETPPPPEPRPLDVGEVRLRRSDLRVAVATPTPPFWGARVIENVALKALLPLLNETMLYRFHWGYKTGDRDPAEWRKWVEGEARPILLQLVEECAAGGILEAKAAYGYWRCAADGDALVLFDDGGTNEVARFTFPRQRRRGGLCIADFFRTIESNERDVVALQVVTVGERASVEARRLFAEDRYRDYVNQHGFSVEMTEALAEYVHKRVRDELGFGHEDARDPGKLLKQGYRGTRYSFGYSACPNLEDQRLLLELLDAGRLGVVMAEEGQLHPEESTSALVVHHPQARYFNV